MKKRIISLFLVVVLMFSMSVPSFAYSYTAASSYDFFNTYCENDGNGNYYFPMTFDEYFDFTSSYSMYEKIKLYYPQFLEDISDNSKYLFWRCYVPTTSSYSFVFNVVVYDSKPLFTQTDMYTADYRADIPYRYYVFNMTKSSSGECYLSNFTFYNRKDNLSNYKLSFNNQNNYYWSINGSIPHSSAKVMTGINSIKPFSSDSLETDKKLLYISGSYSDKSTTYANKSLVKVGEEYSYTPPVQSGYVAVPSSFSGIMPDEDLTLPFVYVKTGNSRKLTINYKYANGTQAAESVVQTVKSGSNYSINSPVLEGYTANIPVVEGTMLDEDLEIDVIYSRSFYNLTVKYQFEDGSKAFDDFVSPYMNGFSYSVNSPILEGYTADKEIISGTMPNEDLTEIVTYRKLANEEKSFTLQIDYLFEDGTQAAQSFSQTYAANSSYSVNSPTIEGYTADETLISGIINENVHFTVIYRKENSDSSDDAGSDGSDDNGSSSGENSDVNISDKNWIFQNPAKLPNLDNWSLNNIFKFPILENWKFENPVKLPNLDNWFFKNPAKLPNSED